MEIKAVAIYHGNLVYKKYNPFIGLIRKILRMPPEIIGYMPLTAEQIAAITEAMKSL